MTGGIMNARTANKDAVRVAHNAYLKEMRRHTQAMQMAQAGDAANASGDAGVDEAREYVGDGMENLPIIPAWLRDHRKAQAIETERFVRLALLERYKDKP